MIDGYLREPQPGEFPDRPRPKGWRLVVVDELATPNSEWRKADPPKSTGRCRWMERRQSCGQPVVVELNRGAWKRGVGKVARWWGYCPEHLFGRRWVDGHLETARLVAEDEQP